MLRGLVAAALAVLALLTAVLAGLGVAGGRRLLAHHDRYQDRRWPRVPLSAEFPRLRTGDLVLFGAATASPVTPLFTQTFFSHAGVILVRGGRVFLSEAQRGIEVVPGHRLAVGGDESPFLARARFYRGSVYVARRRAPLGAAAAARLEAAAAAARGCPYPSTARIALSALGVPARGRHCFQHVAALLSAADAAAGLSAAGPVGACRAVCALPGGPQYGEAVLLDYDLGAAAEI